MFVCLMSNKPRGVPYTGVTSDLVRSLYEHKNGITGGFTSRYGLHRLVYFEQIDEPIVAIAREKSVKRWGREWKFGLVEATNPHWVDLYPSLLG